MRFLISLMLSLATSFSLAIPVGAINSSAFTGSNGIQETVDYNPEPITIDGITYGKEAHLVLHSVTITLDSSSQTRSSLATVHPAGWTDPFHNECFRWGSSYACNNEAAYFFYTGTAYAAGNVYNQQRVLEVKVKYTRDGRDLTSWGVSQAKYASGKWNPGSVATVKANDTPNSNARKTQFHYDYFTIDSRHVA